MAIEFKRNDYAGHFPEFWRGEAKILPGGFKPKKDVPVGTILRKGVPLFVDFDTKTAAICKTAKVLNGGTTKEVRIGKGHYFAVGDVITKYGDGKSTPSISAINTTNADYDVITLSAAYTGIKADDIIVESEAVESGDAAPLYTPNMVCGAEREFDGKGLPTIDAAFEVTVLLPSLAAPMLKEWFVEDGKGVGLKLNPKIIYIKQ